MNITTVLQLHKKDRMLLMFLILITTIVSCSKNDGPQPPNNEVNATVLHASGKTVAINAKGWNAVMGCGSFGIGTHVDGTNEGRKEAVYINVINNPVSVINNPCVTSAGTFTISCQYRTNVDTGAIYTNTVVSNPGSITFTTVSNQNMEGTFRTVCRSLNDSVIITGTFKGVHIQ